MSTSSDPAPPSYSSPVAPTWAPPALPPLGPQTSGQAATLGQNIQPFDPYATTNAPPVGVPGFQQAPATPGTLGTDPMMASPWSCYPNCPPVYNPQSAPYQQPVPYQGPASPVLPNGLPTAQLQRLFQETGFRYTWLYGAKENELEMNDVDVSTTLVLQNFAHSPNGLRITPGFIFHFLDGPQPPLPDGKTTSLPPRIYSAYLDAQWDPRLTQQFWLELNFRTGVYSDMEFVSSDSVRFMGTGMGALQMTPTIIFKLGATYLDRLKVKILPAGGVVWRPNPQTNFAFIFPTPKLSQYWTTAGNVDVWWYLGGEYGGGNWTIERETMPLSGDRIDINDYRFFLGLDFFGLQQRHSFFEVGYVFKRDLVFDRNPIDDLDLKDTVMMRAGFQF